MEMKRKRCMVKNRYGWVVILVLLTLIAAACGGNDKKNSGGAAPGESGTVEPTSLFPPTWTPVPTLTPAPRATIEYTYEPPTQPPMSPFPTRGPLTPGPTLAPGQTQASGAGGPSAGITMTLTADKINAILIQQFNTLTSYLEGTPDIQFQEGQLRVGLTVFTTPADRSTARPIVIESGAAVEDGYIRLNLQQVYFVDDNTPYEDAVTGYLLGTVETAVNDLVRQLYLDQYPDNPNYTVTGLTITPQGIVVEVMPQG
jgi:hypothetical protein